VKEGVPLPRRCRSAATIMPMAVLGCTAAAARAHTGVAQLLTAAPVAQCLRCATARADWHPRARKEAPHKCSSLNWTDSTRCAFMPVGCDAVLSHLGEVAIQVGAHKGALRVEIALRVLPVRYRRSRSTAHGEYGTDDRGGRRTAAGTE
jgi:hypothetical protein